LLSDILSLFNYPMSLLLFGTAIVVMGWIIYFIHCLQAQGGKALTGIYSSYVAYSFSIMLWIICNAYFHTGLLVELGSGFAIGVAKAANIFSYMAFAFAFLFSCRLTSKSPNNKIKIWQKVLLVMASTYALYVNIVSGYTVQGVSIVGPSDFVIHFGGATTLFFSIVILLTCLTLINLLGLSRGNDRLKKLKSTYMVIGIIIFMLSTAIIHTVVTVVFNDFSLSWLPPALSISELLLMGYAVLCTRFYSWRYLLHLSTSFMVTSALYIAPIILIHDWLSFTHHLIISSIWCVLCGLTWKHAWRFSRQISSQIIYGEIHTPVDKIFALVEDFQSSSQRAMEKLAKLLNLHQDQTILVSDAHANELYSTYLNHDDSVLLLEEVEHHISHSKSKQLRDIREQMTQNNTAMILPLYDSKNALSHLILSPQKENGTLFSNEEISALQKMLKKVESYIHCERNVCQAQAMAKSIAHEMRNPLAQIQLHLEKLDSMVKAASLSTTLSDEVDKGKEAIYRGSQLIDIILRETNQSAFNRESLQHSSIAHLVDKVLDQYAFSSDSASERIHFDSSDDFEFKVNETLFGFILFNLLRNAVYYFDDYPDSHIEITLEQGKKHNLLKFKDFGPGIEPQIVQRVFDDFFTYQKRGGSGLGLAYCKRVMKTFSGNIKCHSVYGQHTEFVLRFPKVNKRVSSLKQKLAQSPIAPLTAETPENLMAKRNYRDINVLVTDDNQTQRALVRIYLEQLGANVLEAQNGQEAIEAIGNHSIDIVLMDVQMPVMNGFEATTAIKHYYPDLPIIALSGESGEQEVALITSIMDGRLVKPTTKLILAQTINKWVEDKTTRSQLHHNSKKKTTPHEAETLCSH